MSLRLAVIGLLLLTACTGPANSAEAAPELAGTQWMITQIDGQETTAKLLTMSFEEDRFSAYFGCNHASGGYRQQAAEVRFDQVAITAMACLDQTGVFETQGLAALDQVRQVRAGSKGPELQDAAGTVLIALAELPAASLTETTWRLTSFLDPEATAAAAGITLTITDDVLQGKACNSFRGPVSISGEDFEAGPIASTRMACPDADLTRAEQRLLAALESATHYSIDGQQLTLLSADGTGLQFSAQR